MENELYKVNCNTGERTALYPITTLENVVNRCTGETLDAILQRYNHILLPFKDNSKSLTRKQVPGYLRRRGLWITYRSCKGTPVTEWYNSDDFTDKAWGNQCNWVQLVYKDLVLELIKQSTAWYKNTKKSITGDIKSLFHWYETSKSFLNNQENNLIPLDTIAIIEETSQFYIQGMLIGVSSKDFEALKERVEACEKNKVDKEEGKGLSTCDFTKELKDKLEQLLPYTIEELDKILT